MPDAAASKKQIEAELSSRQVTLGLGQSTTTFQVTVYNDSDRFASFQVKLLAAGVPEVASQPWYRLTPSVSSKIPAGDCTQFQVEIFDLPPIAQEFQGAIDLTVEITSRELPNQYDRPSLRLLATGLQSQPPGLSLLMPTLQASPGDRVEIVGQIHNPTAFPMEAVIRLTGLPDSWFPEGVQQSLPLPPGKLQKVTFDCQVPPPMQAMSGLYSLQLQASGRFPGVTTAGQLQILPAGPLSLACNPLEAVIPEQLGRWQNPTQGTANLALQLDNGSNTAPIVQVTVKEVQTERHWFGQHRRSPAEPAPLATGTMLGELPNPLPVGLTTVPLQIHRRLPWLGWTRLKRFEVQATAAASPIPFTPNTQSVQVRLFPVIPFWLQLLGAFLALGLGAFLWWWLNDPGHRGPVKSVKFNGQGTEVVSGSDDQTIRRWRVDGSNLITQNRIGGLDKAVRVVRYRPVNNDQIAIGFENGEIQLANLLTGQRSRLNTGKDDRVLDLVFSQDARTLYSGHGSGLVLQWDTSQFSDQSAPQRAYNTQFVIDAMAPIGQDDSYLAVAGRHNRLMILETKQNVSSSKTAQLIDLSAYPAGSPNDYIASLSSAPQQPNLLAVGDTQGRISLWNTQTCLQTKGRCEAIAPPWLGHGGSAVRSVALSRDGCFLASGGDDGQVKLWALDGQGVRRSSSQEGRVLGRNHQPMSAVDVVQIRDRVLVTSGGDDHAVRLYQVPLANDGRPVDRCPVLAGEG